jgi:hypothetical protein
MNGRDMILVLAHLFRKKGSPVPIVEAVDFLSFKCRFGAPSVMRKLLATALNNEIISKEGSNIIAEFLYDKQTLSLNLASSLEEKIQFKDDVEPIS